MYCELGAWGMEGENLFLAHGSRNFRFACVSEVESGAHEERLIDEIFEHRGYIKYARPVLHETDALNVKFGISLQQIIDVVSIILSNR